ncbi:MAG: hypothetical protein O7C63_00780 [Alphaproteobacteria bacterium]|nr:hypothetical protein [Alphaproteobacteria bacterium]
MTAGGHTTARYEVAGFAGIGLATGIVTMFIQPFGGLAGPALEDLAGDVRWLDSLFEFVAAWGPGFVFGAALGAWIARRGPRSVWRWLGFTAASTGSWYAGVTAAIRATDFVPAGAGDLAEPLISGFAGGLVGAAIVAAGAALCYPFARRIATVAAITAVGAVAGLLLAAGYDNGPHLLFPVWQTLVAALIGAAATRRTGTQSRSAT